MATATVIVVRKFGGIIGRSQKWQVLIDGADVGTLAINQTVELPVGPGQHTLRLKTPGRLMSPERSFEIAEGEQIRFSCHSQFLWPLMLAALLRQARLLDPAEHGVSQAVPSSCASGPPARLPSVGLRPGSGLPHPRAGSGRPPRRQATPWDQKRTDIFGHPAKTVAAADRAGIPLSRSWIKSFFFFSLTSRGLRLADRARGPLGRRLSGYSVSGAPPSHAAGILGVGISCCAGCAVWAGCDAPMGPGLVRREVQRSVHALASRQYQRTSAQAWPPSATIWWAGSWMPHMAHATVGEARRRSSRGAGDGGFHGAGSCIMGTQPGSSGPLAGDIAAAEEACGPRFLHMDLVAEPRHWRQGTPASR